MIGGDVDAASAGFRVGYEDPPISAVTIRSSSEHGPKEIFPAFGTIYELGADD